MNRFYQILTFIFLLNATETFSQDFPSLNNVVGPSPNASALARYGDIPVNRHTGVPNITVPIYTIKHRKLSLPISLNYHASGIKVREQASWIGLGWSLNAGGMITRVMRGRPDEDNGFFDYDTTVPDQNDPIDATLLQNIADGFVGMTPDLFYFNISGSAGKFIFGNDEAPHFIPQRDIDISVIGNLDGFELITADGIIYQFGDPETTDPNAKGPDITAYNSTWYLTSIISADRSDTISFEYSATTEDIEYQSNLTSARKIYFDVPPGASKYNGQVETPTGGTNTISQVRYLEKIKWANGLVEFGTSATREDLSNGGQRLTDIIIYSKNEVNQYIEEKRFVLNQSYFVSPGGTSYDYKRLRLDEIQETSGVNLLPPYRFTYNPLSLPAKTSFALDHWGYYNGQDGNTSLIPETYFLNAYHGEGNSRAPDEQSMKASVLESVQYPTGGSVTYLFEANTYGSASTIAGGLRVKRIIAEDLVAANNFIKTFEYRDPVSSESSGHLIAGYNYYTTLPVSEDASPNCYEYKCFMISANQVGLGANGGAPVVYEYVTEYAGTDPTKAGKTVYKYTIDPDVGVSSEYPFVPVTDKSWARGRLLEVTRFKYDDASGSYKKLNQIVNTYQTGTNDYSIKGLTVAYAELFDPQILPCNDFTYDIKNNYADSKFYYLAQTDKYLYDPNNESDFTVSSTQYFYDNQANHLQLNRIEKTNASGRTVKTLLKYPHDYTASGVLGSMQTQHIKSPVVEKSVWEVYGTTDYLVGYTKTDFMEYAESGYARIYPQYVYAGKFDKPIEKTFTEVPSTYYTKTATFEKYDAFGNLLEGKKEHDLPKSTIYGYRSSLPVALVDNATHDAVAYTGFESESYGNWQIDAGPLNTSFDFDMNYTSTTIQLRGSQTVDWSYNITMTSGPNPTLTFTQGSTSYEEALLGTSGTGSLSLTEGEWQVALWYDEQNVSDISVTLNYVTNKSVQTSNDAKTGIKALSVQSGNEITKNDLPVASYYLHYWQKEGSVSVTLSGASNPETLTLASDPDGWELIRKKIEISNAVNEIKVTGSSCKLDELRLHPVDAAMVTRAYDLFDGPVSISDHNFFANYHEYDAFARPVVVKDHDGNIRQYQQYHLLGQ